MNSPAAAARPSWVQNTTVGCFAPLPVVAPGGGYWAALSG
jgi:hypothetical protein